MAETIIKVNGDSEGAVKALDAAAKSIAGLDASVDSLNEEMTATSRSTASFTAGQAQIQRTAQATQQKMQSAAGALGQLGGALGQVSPAAGAAGSAISSLGSAVGSLPSLLNPATAAMAAITLAVTAGVVAWKKHQEEIKQNIIAMEKARKEAAELRAAIQSTIDQQILTDFGELTGAIDGLSGVMASIKREATLFNREIIEENTQEHVDKLEEKFRSVEAVLGSLTEEIRIQEGALADMEGAARATYTTKDIEQQKELIERLNASVRALTPSILSHQKAWLDAEEALALYNEGVARLKKEEEARAAAEAARAAAEAKRAREEAARQAEIRRQAEANRLLIEASTTLDFSAVNAALEEGSRLGDILASTLKGMDEGFLEDAGVNLSALNDLIDKNMTAQERLAVLQKERSDAIAREIALEEERAAARAREAADLDARIRQNQEISSITLEQDEWYRRLTMSAEEKLKFDKEQLEIALAMLDAGEALTAEQRRRIEEAQAAAEREATNGKEGNRLDGINEGLNKLGTSAEGLVQGSLGMMTDSLLQIIETGEKMGDVLPKAIMQFIGQQASQMAGLAAAQALMMTFSMLPSEQAKAPGMWAAAGALTAVAIGAGVAVKAVGKRGKNSGASPQESTGGGTNVFIEDSRNSNAYAQSGMRARDYGAAQSNADRLNIDRGRSWA